MLGFFGQKGACIRGKPLSNDKIYTASVQLSIVHTKHYCTLTAHKTFIEDTQFFIFIHSSFKVPQILFMLIKKNVKTNF